MQYAITLGANVEELAFASWSWLFKAALSKPHLAGIKKLIR